jgi:hypothetical protein
MPALYLFGRRTLLAGDDLQASALLASCVSAAQLFVLVPYTSYHVVDLLLTASSSSSSSSWSPGGYADVDVDAGGMTAGMAAAYHTAGRRRRRRLLDDDVDDYRAEACYDATSGYLDLSFLRILLSYLIGVALCSAISLRYERRIFEVSSRGTPTTGARLRAPLGKLIETKMTSLAGINASLLLFGLWAGLSRGTTGARYGECLPPSWWMAYASLLLSQAAQSLVAIATLLSLRGVPPVKSSSPTGYGVMTTETNGGGTSDDDPYRRDFDHDYGDGNGGGDHRRGIRDVHGNSVHHHHIAEEMWQARCEGCCRILAVSTCFLFGGRGIVSHAAEGGMGGNGGGGGGVGGGHKFYGDIARALADYFADFDDPGEEGGLDVVPSDVGLGFVMLRHVQAQRRMIARGDAPSQSRSRRGDESDGRGRGSGGPPPTPSARSSLTAREADVTSSSSSSSMDDGTTLLFRRSLSGGEGGTEQPTLSPASSRTDDEEAYRSFSRAVLSPSNSDDYALIEEGARFARHQLAIYTVRYRVPFLFLHSMELRPVVRRSGGGVYVQV